MTRAEFMRETSCTRAQADALLAAGLPHETVGHGRSATIRIDRARAMAWLADRATGRRPPQPAGPPAPACAQILAEVPPPYAPLLIGALEAIYAVSWFARYVALLEGCSEEQAEQVGGGTSLMLIAHFERLFRDLGL